MEVATIDNGVSEKIRKCITWQYDNAPHLIGMIGMIKSFYDAAVRTQFDRFRSTTFDIKNLDSFGAVVWGMLLGVQRPKYLNTSTGQMEPISDGFYTRLVAGRAQLIFSNYSMEALGRAVKTTYGDTITVRDNFDCSITYIRIADRPWEEDWLAQNNPDAAFWHAAGITVKYEQGA